MLPFSLACCSFGFCCSDLHLLVRIFPCAFSVYFYLFGFVLAPFKGCGNRRSNLDWHCSDISFACFLFSLWYSDISLCRCRFSFRCSEKILYCCHPVLLLFGFGLMVFGCFLSPFSFALLCTDIFFCCCLFSFRCSDISLYCCRFSLHCHLSVFAAITLSETVRILLSSPLVCPVFLACLSCLFWFVCGRHARCIVCRNPCRVGFVRALFAAFVSPVALIFMKIDHLASNGFSWCKTCLSVLCFSCLACRSVRLPALLLYNIIWLSFARVLCFRLEGLLVSCLCAVSCRCVTLPGCFSAVAIC